jgi:Zn-dependent metalloprotease/subtilisin-like proprotein convertase family protein
MASVGPISGNRVNETVTNPQGGVAAPAQQQQVRDAQPVETSRPAETQFEGQSKRPSGEKLQGGATQHVPLPSILPGEPARLPQAGAISVNSAEGKALVKESEAALKGRFSQELGRASASQEFVPRSIERDDLGMTHVRMDRTHNGLKVFGEQAIVHFGRDGQVSDITGEASKLPDTLGLEKPKLSEKEARKIVQEAYGKDTDKPISLEKVIVRGDDGQYRTAYRAEAQNLFGGSRPERMNFLIDAETGKQLKPAWNQLGGIELPQGPRAGGDPVESKATATPNARVNDNATVTSKVKLDKDMNLDSMKLDLDIAHTYKGDLKISLVSPSGKEYVVHNRTGGSADNVKGSFDVTSAFKNEPKIDGEWTLKVQDMARLDTGTLKSWSLTAKGKEKGEQPPPPPPPPPGGADDTSLYAGKVDVGATRNPDGTWKLLDSTRGKGVETRNANNASSGSGAKVFTDNNNVWGEATDPANQKGAVDAQYGAQMTYDFYKDILGRNSIDNNGEKLISNVHINRNYVNAFWDGSTMNYGDGDGRQASILTSIDVAGHEITHGLTERTAGLIYSGESGGLNEAMSDILGGYGVEWYAMQKNGQLKANPEKIGEQVWTPGTAGDALRYMDDPTKDNYSIDHYSKYPQQTEVHGSSGIANNAFYLLANGGKNKTSGMTVTDPIGSEKALKIFGRALTTYMTPNTTFKQGAEACIKAATDLYGANSAEVQKVKDAWKAVGVLQ